MSVHLESALTPTLDNATLIRAVADNVAHPGFASGRRLAQAVFAYLIVMTLLVTWAPFDFSSSRAHGFTMEWTPADLILNVVMFLPIGFFGAAAGTARTPRLWWRVGLLGALFSVGIEAGQLLIADRYSSVLDVCTNGLGAAVGAYAYHRVWMRVRLNARTVSTLALELPLTGLVMLLVPLLWASGLGSTEDSRLWLVLLVAAFGGALLGAVHGAYLQHTGRVLRTSLLIATALWFLVAALPGAAMRSDVRWDVLLAGTTLAVGAAWLRSYSASRARERDGAQRVELPTLRMVLPLFACYLVLSSLWPLDAFDGVWRGAWALAPARSSLSTTLLMRAIEHLAAMTIAGYVTAELHGRANRPYRMVWPRVLGSALALTLVLEAARGWNTAQGASAALGGLAVAAALFGGWLYHVQRDHVRALLAETR